MSNITYLQNATNQPYDSAALGYVSGEKMKQGIFDTAEYLQVSAGAIAGVMAEERMDWGWKQKRMDWWAEYGYTTNSIIQALEETYWMSDDERNSLPEKTSERTHAEWVSEYEAIKGDIEEDNTPSISDKIKHPGFIDAGPSNFRIGKAIEFVNKYADEYPDLRLDIYKNDYALLVSHLMSEAEPLAAKLYGLYLLEAEEWFKEQGAYNGQWDKLPQEFKDSLLITFINRGPKSMAEAKEKLYKGIDYEPQPGLTTSAGMNHLLNAAAIGSSMGVAGYGENIQSASDFSQEALSQGAQGIAYRYALYRLRYVVLPDLDYSAYNQNGELDLYNEDAGKGTLTEKYIKDRADFINLIAVYNVTDGKDNFLSDTWRLPFWQWGDTFIQDNASGTHLTVDGWDIGIADRKNIIFGGSDIDYILGGKSDDRLYGGAGDDILDGGQGDDYLEGNADDDILYGGIGKDTLWGGADDDTLYGNDDNEADLLKGGVGHDTYYVGNLDTLLDSDGQGRVIFNGVELHGGEYIGANQWQAGEGLIFTLLNAGNGQHDLSVSLGGQQILIQDYGQGELGIQLDGGVVPTKPTQANGITVQGDRVPYQQPWDYWLWINNPNWPYLFNGFGNLIYTDVPQRFFPDKIFDGPGDDKIFAGDGTNVIFAYNGGNNLIVTGANDDYIMAGDGRDQIFAGGLNDIILAGAGNDIVYGEDGRDVIDGGAGNDFLVGGNGADAIHGGSGDDEIYGGQTLTWEQALNDSGTAEGQPGDLLAGGQGNDMIIGEATDDVLLGGEGDDVLVGREGNDILFGDSDTLFVAPYTQQFSAMIGSYRWPLPPSYGSNNPYSSSPALSITFEKIDHGAGSENRYEVILTSRDNPEASVENWLRPATQGGNDQLHGGSGDDWLFGEFGNDTLDGGTGDDVLIGGVGNDTYRFGSGYGHDIVLENDATQGNMDTILLTSELNPADVKVTRSGNSLRLSLNGGTDTLTLQDWFVDAQHQVERVLFHDGTQWDVDALIAQIVPLAPHNTAPTPSDTPLDPLNAKAGEAFLYRVPSTAFTDADADDTLSLSATLADGSPLPPWLVFDPITQSFTGTPPNDSTLGIRLTATDSGGLSADTTLKLIIGSGKAVLAGSSGDDLLTGGDDDDTLNGGAGNDTLIGGLGNDRLSGGIGNDTYIFRRGDGQDRLIDSGQNAGQSNVLVFSDYALDELTLFCTGNSLRFQFAKGDGFDSILLDNYFNRMANSGNDEILSKVRFANGQSFSVQALITQLGVQLDPTTSDINTQTFTRFDDLIFGTAEAETINGGDGNDTLFGNAGDDTLAGGAGHDTLIGGLGNDRLSGGIGNDTYIFRRGDGQDRLIDSGQNAGQNNILVFSDYALDELSLFCTGNSLRFQFAKGDGFDSILLDNYFNRMANSGNDEILSEVRFADGQSFGVQALITQLGVQLDPATSDINTQTFTRFDDLIFGSAHAETINGGEGNDILIGGRGNDLLNGGAGSDTYRYTFGDGNDTITNRDSSAGRIDTLVLKGIHPDDVTLEKRGSDLLLLIQPTGESITLAHYFKGSPTDQIDRVQFDNGTSWDKAEIARRSAADYRPDALTTVATSLRLGSVAESTPFAENPSANPDTLPMSDAVAAAHALFAEKAAPLSALSLIPSWAALSAANVEMAATAETPAAGQWLSAATLRQSTQAPIMIDAWARTHARLDAHLAASDTAALGSDPATHSTGNASFAALALSSGTQDVGNSGLGNSLQSLRLQTALHEGVKLG